MGSTQVKTVEEKTTLAEQSLAKRQGQRPVPAFHGTFLAAGLPGNPRGDAYASILNRMAKGRRTQDYLVQLQRTYGNRYVQRVLALARQEDGQEVAPEVQSAIERSRSGGQALEGGVRLQMERAFGADLSRVRVHTGPEAHSLNDAVSAVAFTTGRDIFFREGAYNPGSSAGRELLAHELTHVVQQGGAAAVQGKMVLGDAGDPYEHEADSFAKQVIATLDADAAWQSGRSLSVGSGAVRRQCACGVHTSSGGECEECRQKREASVERPSCAKLSEVCSVKTATVRKSHPRMEAGEPHPHLATPPHNPVRVSPRVLLRIAGEPPRSLATPPHNPVRMPHNPLRPGVPSKAAPNQLPPRSLRSVRRPVSMTS